MPNGRKRLREAALTPAPDDQQAWLPHVGSLAQRANTESTVEGPHRAACVSFPGVSLLPDYSRQAEIYDETRAASPSVLRPLREGLNGAPGSRLADIGGGTGNYALALKREGWDPVVVDRSPEMLERAAAKGLETIEADAQRLPFDDQSFDAAMMLSMLHHVEDRGAALAEARRILRSGGRLVLKGFTGEDAASLWIVDYFPSSRQWMEATHPPLAAFLAELPGARLINFEYEDMRGRLSRRAVGRSRAGAQGSGEWRNQLLRAHAARSPGRARSWAHTAPRGHRRRSRPKALRHRHGA